MMSRWIPTAGLRREGDSARVPITAAMRSPRAVRAMAAVAFVACAGTAARADDEPVTFTAHVAPIVFVHCATCHRPDGSAPFSLLTYPEVRGRAQQILAAVSRRTMPPWKPEPGYGEFAGARRLTDDQIAVFRRWVESGARKGDDRALPEQPQVSGGWQLGKPDAVLRLASPYRLPPDGTDRLRNFVIPTGEGEHRYVSAWEFRTSNPRVVHHATVVVDATRSSRRLDDQDPQPGYEGMIPTSAANPDGFFLGWTPGQAPFVAAPGIAWSLARDSDLVLMLHLRPSGGWETVDVEVALYFSASPPSRTPAMIRLNRQDIDIPPGEQRYTIRDSYTLPVDVEAVGIQPHAHTLAREIKGFATLQDGNRRWLIYIRSWDFHWQDAYRYAEPVPLPAGTTLTMEYVYDNSKANPANRGRPLARVTFGQRTSDEMGDLWLQVVPRRAADLPLLTRSVRQKLLPQHIAGYRMMLESDPDNPSLHDDLALLLFEAGDGEGVAREFAESLRLRPRAPAAHYNFGNALLPLGRFEEAERHFRDAVAIDPNYAPGHFGLGLALQALGRADEASRSYKRALALRPDWLEAQDRLREVEPIGRPR